MTPAELVTARRIRRREFLALPALACAVRGDSAEPRRIISTGPGITEILFGLGLGDRVAGVTNYCKFPPQVNKLPRIGTWTTPNMELILSLRPDLIIVQRTTVHESSRFHAVGLKTLDVSLDRVQDIFSTIDAIGATCRVTDRSRKLSSDIRSGLQQIRTQVGQRPPTSILFVVGRNPGTLDGLIAVGPNSYLDEVVTVAGGKNVLADARVPYVKVLDEEIVARKPEVVVDMGEHADATAITPAQVQSEVALWGRYPTIPAVRNHRIHIVASEIFVVPGPRVVDCARQLAALLHPEARSPEKRR